MRPTRAPLALLAAATGLSGPACVGHQPVAGRAVEPVAYATLHREWTRELKLYDSLETRLILRATLQSEDFRRGYAQELASRAALDAQTYQQLLSEQLAEAEAGWTVVFSAMRTDRAARSFGPEEDDAWHLSLLVDGRPCTTRSTERISRPNATHLALYPQLNGWSDLWEAHFDKDCGSGEQVVMVVAGALGSGEVEWSLRN